MAARLKLAHRQGLFPLGLPAMPPSLGPPNLTTNIPTHLQTFLYQQHQNPSLSNQPSQLLNALSVSSNATEIINATTFR